MGRMRPDDLPIVLLGSLDDTLLGGTLCAEGCYKRAVLARENYDVWVRLVEVVFRGELQIERFVFGDRIQRIVDRDESGIGELTNTDPESPVSK